MQQRMIATQSIIFGIEFRRIAAGMPAWVALTQPAAQAEQAPVLKFAARTVPAQR